MDGGAKFIVANFKAFIETGRSTFGGRVTNAMMGLFGAMVPKALRAENWPLERR